MLSKYEIIRNEGFTDAQIKDGLKSFLDIDTDDVENTVNISLDDELVGELIIELQYNKLK